MSEIVLSEQDARLRSADEQVSVLLAFYDNPFQVEQRQLDAGFVRRRRKSLEALSQALRSELATRDILPKQQDPEVSAWQFFVDRAGGLLRDEPHAVPLAEERKLLELGEQLVRDDSLGDAAIRQGVSETRWAIRELEETGE